jgi:hypothetical protein
MSSASLSSQQKDMVVKKLSSKKMEEESIYVNLKSSNKKSIEIDSN